MSRGIEAPLDGKSKSSSGINIAERGGNVLLSVYSNSLSLNSGVTFLIQSYFICLTKYKSNKEINVLFVSVIAYKSSSVFRLPS